MGIIEEIETQSAADPAGRSSPRSRPSSPGFAATTSRSSATAVTTSINVDGEDALRIVSGLGILRVRSGDERRGELRRAAAGGARVRARAGPADRHEGERALDRPSPGLSRLRRRSSASTPRGNVCGEHRFLGLYTARAYGAKPADIPLLRRKIANVIARAGLPQGGHAGKALVNILDNVPARRALPDQRGRALRARRWASCTSASGSASACSCAATCSSASSSCMIYAPRENYTTELREKWQAILLKAFNGTSSEFNVQLSEVGARARPGHRAHDARRRSRTTTCRELEERLAQAARRWDDDLRAALVDVARRSARQRALSPVRRRVAGGLSRRCRRARRGARHRADGVPVAARDRSAMSAVPSARGRARDAALQALPRRARR